MVRAESERRSKTWKGDEIPSCCATAGSTLMLSEDDEEGVEEEEEEEAVDVAVVDGR